MEWPVRGTRRDDAAPIMNAHSRLTSIPANFLRIPKTPRTGASRR